MNRFRRGGSGLFLAILGTLPFAAGASAESTELSAEQRFSEIQVGVVEELRLDLSSTLRGDLLAAMHAEMVPMVESARIAQELGEQESDWELAAQMGGN